MWSLSVRGFSDRFGTKRGEASGVSSPPVTVELCPPKNSYAEALTPAPQDVIVFGDSILTELIKMK